MVTRATINLATGEMTEDEVELPPPPALTVDDYTRAIQALLDETAQTRQYDSIQTAVTYAGDPNPAFAAEAQALLEYRSAVWTYALAELAKVQGGLREPPTVAEFIDELPAMVWP